MTTKSIRRLLVALAVAVVLPLPVLAQGSQVLQSGTVEQVKIAVWDAETRDELAQLAPGETYRLKAGDSVILRTFVPRGKHDGPKNERYYLGSRWSSANGGGGRIDVSRADAGKGECEIYGVRKGTGQAVEVSYELTGVKTTRPYMAKSSIKIQVVEGHANQGGNTGGGKVPPPSTGSRADQMVDHFYEGILMRDRNRGEGDEWVRQIETGGVRAAREVAIRISESRESQVQVYERSDNKDRLRALYRHLLNMDEIPSYSWEQNQQIIAKSGIAEVVRNMVNSDRFTEIHYPRR